MSRDRFGTVAEASASAAAYAAATVLLLAGCAGPTKDRDASAKSLFEQTTSRYHLASVAAVGANREKLLKKAAAGYSRLLREYRDQPYWCAQALRSLGNVRAAQGRLDEAVTLYAQVAAQYPSLDWEVLQAWKSAADLLWDSGRVDTARRYYEKIVAKYEATEDPAIVKLIVRASKSRLADGSSLGCLEVSLGIDRLRGSARG